MTKGAGIMTAKSVMIVMGILIFGAMAQAQKNTAPPPRSRAEVEAILAKAPKHEGALRHLNILLVAGPKDHGPGEHDYPRWQKEWAPLMSKADNVSITTAFGWPKPEDWNGVDLAVFY